MKVGTWFTDVCSVREILLHRYGMSRGHAEASTRRIESLAASDGLIPTGRWTTAPRLFDH